MSSYAMSYDEQQQRADFAPPTGKSDGNTWDNFSQYCFPFPEPMALISSTTSSTSTSASSSSWHRSSSGGGAPADHHAMRTSAAGPAAADCSPSTVSSLESWNMMNDGPIGRHGGGDDNAALAPSASLLLRYVSDCGSAQSDAGSGAGASSGSSAAQQNGDNNNEDFGLIGKLVVQQGKASGAATTTTTKARGGNHNHNNRNDKKRRQHQQDSSTISSYKKKKPEGRKGDPRMHAAVSLRLGNPKMTLVDALVGGGFVFPTLGEPGATDRNTHDTDGALLYQRKNQLNRRLRLAKNKAKGLLTSKTTTTKKSPGSGSSSRACSPVQSSDEESSCCASSGTTALEETEAQAQEVMGRHDEQQRADNITNNAAAAAAAAAESNDFLAFLDDCDVLRHIFDDEQQQQPMPHPSCAAGRPSPYQDALDRIDLRGIAPIPL